MTTIKKIPGNCLQYSDEWHALLSEQCSQRRDEKSSVSLIAQWVFHTHTAQTTDRCGILNTILITRYITHPCCLAQLPGTSLIDFILKNDFKRRKCVSNVRNIHGQSGDGMHDNDQDICCECGCQ